VKLANHIYPATPAATNDPGELKITIRKFYRINGTSTQLKGVEPDIILPDVLNYSTDIGESALENALPCDTNAPANYRSLNLVQPYLAELRRFSDARVATNQDFNYVRQDIAQYQKARAEKTATLNEQEAIRQREADNARNLARQAEWAMRPLSNKRIYNITVENAGLPGLPPPEALRTTNLNVVVTATNANGSVCIMTTNNSFAVGVLLSQFETNTPSGPLHLGTVVTQSHPDAALVQPRSLRAQPRAVVTQSAPDAMLDETERILEDYISLLSKNNSVVVNQRGDL
jgi:hypothetical protein